MIDNFEDIKNILITDMTIGDILNLRKVEIDYTRKEKDYAE